MNRREFITVLGAAVAWPLVANAQSQMPTIAYISSRSVASDAQLVSAFRAGLNNAGFVEDRNVAVEFQWAEGQYDRLPALMATAVAKRRSLILAAGSPAALAARAATSTIPILFNSGTDPVSIGLVDSLNRPAGNMSGVVTLVGDLAEKNFGVLHQLLPRVRKIAVLTNPAREPVARHLADVNAAARAVGVEIVAFQASTTPDLETAFEDMAQQVQALLVLADPFLFTVASKIIALAARHVLPAMYFRREFAAAGGLMSYGSVASEPYRQLGLYAGRILKGEKPADLPVVRPTKFELVINLITARELGLTVPPTLLATADEVIE